VLEAKTNEWPNGLAHLVVAALFKKYQPQDTITRVELRQRLNQVRMKKGQDPVTLFDQISSIKNMYNTSTKQIDQEDLIAVVLDAAPIEYQALLTAEQRMKGATVTLSDLQVVMNQYWRQTKSAREKDKTNDESELTLAVFEGICYNCHKKGHKSFNCPDKKKTTNGQRRSRFNKKCSTCGKVGHLTEKCFEREENKDKRPSWWKSTLGKGNENAAKATMDGGGTNLEFLLYAMTFPATHELLNDPNVWIADTAATVHMTPNKTGMIDIRTASENDTVTMGNKQVEKTTEIGNIPAKVCDNQGHELVATMMKDVAIVPNSGYNLFSLTKLMEAGWTLIGQKSKMILKKDDHELVFDIAIRTPKGVLYAIYLKRTSEIAGAATDKKIRVTIAQAHGRLGHCGEDVTRKTAKLLGWELIPGPMMPCESCAAGKAKQKNVPKISEGKPAEDGKSRIFLDIATVKSKEGKPKATKPNWRIMVDERTQLKFSNFYPTKNGMVEPTCEQFHKWKSNGILVDYVRMDNAGENTLLQKRSESKDWKLGIKFEYTARATPQQNALAEVSLATLANRGRAIMSAANLPEEIRCVFGSIQDGYFVGWIGSN